MDLTPPHPTTPPSRSTTRERTHNVSTTEPSWSPPRWVSSTLPPPVGNPPSHPYNTSTTIPTQPQQPRNTLQQLGLVISDAIAIHLHGAKRGTLRQATLEEQAEHDNDEDNNDPSPHGTTR